MTNELPDTSIEIMGKHYQIKCPESEVDALRQAARYLEEEMRKTRDSGVLCVDKVVVITALNVIHQLQTFEQHKNQGLQQINQRILDLQSKVDHALARNTQMELHSAE